MKPSGPVPPYFEADDDGELLVGGVPVTTLVEQAGDTPLFVYDMAVIRQQIARLRKVMPAELALHYAIKANPYAPLLREIVNDVDGLDVASAGEMRMAIAAGMSPAAISFAGPGKRDRELEAAIAAGVTLNLESESEAERALAIASRLGVRLRAAVRVNPDFGLRGSGMRMGGGARPFGVDADRVPPLLRRLVDAGADWRGLHVFAGSQALDADAIIEAQAATIALAAAITKDADVMAPPEVNLGGGFGVPYFAGDRALDVDAVGTALTGALAGRPSSLAGTRFAIELGRWFVAEAGVYLTRIIDRKESRGETFLVTDGGLHHQLAASGNFGTVVRRNYPIALANRFGTSPDEVVSVVGCLCTPIDRLGEQVALARAEVGDLVAIFLAGAYGATASPQAFLGHPAPREMLLADGVISLS
jgi:diaminopimelate decarboxylase